MSHACCSLPPPNDTTLPPNVSLEEEKDSLDSLGLRTLFAGFATAFVMALGLFWPSQVWVMVWASVSALLYAGQPFFFSTLQALRQRQAPMDMPLSLALALMTALGLFELFHQGSFALFSSVLPLLFVLLLGRYLTLKTHSRASRASAELLSLFSGTATIIEGGETHEKPKRELKPGMILSVAIGEKIAADGEVTQGASEIDLSIITGETLPQPVEVGSFVFGGAINLIRPLHVRVSASSADSFLGEVIQWMRRAEQGHAPFVQLADRAARFYAPAILALFLLLFCGWWLGAEKSWPEALFTALPVLLIFCPCALGLAVPTAHILAASRLFRRGILVKTGDALERLSRVDTVVFDKMGTLTLGQPHLVNRADISTEELKLAASLAARSSHPLARAVVAAHGDGPLYALDVLEVPGEGLEADLKGTPVRLGRREWSGPTSFPADTKTEMWLRVGYKPPRRLAFIDALRPDALDVINRLKKEGLSLFLLSGDRAPIVSEMADSLGIEQAYAQFSPADKSAFIERLQQDGHKVLMVGDGLNDAATLTTADVSLSPSGAFDIKQNAADFVFQGENLSSVLESLLTAKKSERLVKENIVWAVFYNICALPLALFGLVTPLIAATAMSISSLSVVLNAQRMRR